MKSIKYVTIFIILAMCFLDLAGNALSNQWMPQWKVGDWWIIKSRSGIQFGPPIEKPPDINTIPPSKKYYKVIGIERVNGQECFAVEQRRLPIDKYLPELKTVYYFRKDNLQIVRTTIYSYVQGKLQKPISFDYKYNYKVPFVCANKDLNIFPSFPLIYKGAEADSLALKQSDPRYTTKVSQIVSVRRIEEFKQMIMSTDTIYASEGDCYYVLLETGCPGSLSRKTTEVKEIWIPSLPWYLYSESSIIIENGKTKPLYMYKRWLADYSGWHKNKK